MNYFKNIDMFSSLSSDDQEKLSSFCQFRELSSSEFLFQQGDEATAMYLILEGNFSVIKDSVQINTLTPGSIVGEIAFLDDTKVRNASIQCIDSGTVITIIKYAMGEMFTRYPELHRKIQEIIEERSS